MSIPTQVIAQRDFSAGQLDEASLRRDDVEIMRAGLRTARNVRLLNTGSMTRRPGRRVLFSTDGISYRVRPAPRENWWMTLEAGRVIFRSLDLSASQTIEEMPWTADALPDLRFVEYSSTIIIAGPDMRPQLFTFRRSTRVWEHEAFSFAEDVTGAIRQPFYNFFEGSSITLQPSGRSGSITLNFSGDVLDAGHIGVRFRYGDRQFEITGVTSPSEGTADVIEQLPPTITLTLDNYNGIEVGDVIEGLDSGCRGQVVAVGPPLTVFITTNWNGFIVSGDKESVVGPRSRGVAQSQSSASPAATVLWEEALCSDFRGWPRSVNKSVQRIVFCNFEQLSAAIIWSAVGTQNDFLVGSDRDDPIFELVPANTTVFDVVEGSDVFVFTDQGPYFIPVSSTSPLIPGSVEFRQISDDAASPIRAQPTTDGLVYINAGLTRVLALIATGQTSKPYIVEDISEFHAELIRKPLTLASTSVDASAPERYIYALNSDGTLAVARYQRQQGGRGWVGWVPWDGFGTLKWVSAYGGDVVVSAEYQAGEETLTFAEIFEEGLILDGTRSLATVTGSDALELEPGLSLLLEEGLPLLLSQDTAFNWAVGTNIAIAQGYWFRGEYEILEDGTLSGVIPVENAIGLVGGFAFDVEVEPFVPHVEGGTSARQRFRRRKLVQVAAVVQRTQALEVAGRLVPFWSAGENEELEPPRRDETYRARPVGRKFDPRWSVRQKLPGALTIIELTSEVTI